MPSLALVPAFAALALPAAAPADPLAGLTTRQLAGQRIVVGYDGPAIPPWLLARVRRGEVGGVILYTRNIRSREAVAAQLRALQRVRRPFGAPLLTLIDQEGGLVARLPGAPAGSAMRMAPRGAAYVRGQGRLTAANLRAAGVNVDLAPVVDLGRPGSYEVRFERTFGSSPATVGTLGAAFAQGLRQGGVAATLKQFPGLGGVRGDTDRATQRVPLSRAALRRDDEAPLRAGIRASAHDPASSQAGLDAVVAAVRSGRLSRSGLLASAQRVLTLRRTLR